MRRRRAIGATLAVLAAAGGCGGSGSGDDSSLPDVRVERLDAAGDLDLRDLDGTPTVLNLWAAWCAPCRRELPAFDAVDEATSDDDVRFVGVDIGDDRDAALAFLADVDVGFAQYRDADGELPAALGAAGMPVTAFVDADGHVVEVHTGQLSEGELETRLADHFGIGAAEK